MSGSESAHKEAIKNFMAQGWAKEETLPPAAPDPATANYAHRREVLGKLFPGQTIVIPAGVEKFRTRSAEYPFRVNNDFYYLTGFKEKGAVLILTPNGSGHDATLYMVPRLDATSPDYFKFPYGEMWVGPRPGLEETTARLGIRTASIEGVKPALQQLDRKTTLFLTGVDPALDWGFRGNRGNKSLSRALAQMRLVKDTHEVAALQQAIDATHHGFNRIVANLGEAIARGERAPEGSFASEARLEGNDVGFATIVADGADGTTLHWSRNDGKVRAGDLLLIDAGIEGHALYTADVTRTIPVSGKFSKEQLEIYELVLAAQKAAIAAAQPGADFKAPGLAAKAVLAAGLLKLGIPNRPLAALELENNDWIGRFMPHGVSHSLGLDVHDSDDISAEYKKQKLVAGQVVTEEPGLYFKPNDLLVPEKYRGIGVRIEDDLLITDKGNRVLSAAIPKEPAALERWVSWSLRGQGLAR